MGNNFIKKIGEINKTKKSKIILAIDEPEINFDLLSSLEPYLVGFKIGAIPIISSSIKTKELCEKFSDKLVLIADLKIADIPYISRKIGKMMKDLSFDAVIAHAFVGEDVLKELNDEIPTIAVVCMTNEGSYLLNENFRLLTQISNKLNLAGVVAPATKPDILREVRKMTNLLIFSPGIGAQGMPYGSAIKNGANFEIIGRAILKSSDPLLEIKKAIKMMEYEQNNRSID